MDSELFKQYPLYLSFHFREEESVWERKKDSVRERERERGREWNKEKKKTRESVWVPYSKSPYTRQRIYCLLESSLSLSVSLFSFVPLSKFGPTLSYSWSRYKYLAWLGWGGRREGGVSVAHEGRRVSPVTGLCFTAEHPTGPRLSVQVCFPRVISAVCETFDCLVVCQVMQSCPAVMKQLLNLFPL